MTQVRSSTQSQPSQSGTLAERYHDVRRRIAQAATRSGRQPDDVLLVAVTKYASIDEIRALLELGHIDFGESRAKNLIQRAAQVDEYLQRRSELGTSKDESDSQQPHGGASGGPAREVRWHMIGHLQRNKVRKLIGPVRLIHSVDSLRLVEEIQNAGARHDTVVEILVQVNSGNDPKKHGIAPAAVRHVLDQIDTMMYLKPRGLMCMAPHEEDPERVRPVFERTHELFVDIVRSGCGGDQFNILSMGMTNDFEVAVECGANMVRIGSAIFGSEPSAHDDDAEDDDDAKKKSTRR